MQQHDIQDTLMSNTLMICSNWGDRFVSSFTCIAMIFLTHADHVTMKAPMHASERGGSRKPVVWGLYLAYVALSQWLRGGPL